MIQKVDFLSRSNPQGSKPVRQVSSGNQRVQNGSAHHDEADSDAESEYIYSKAKEQKRLHNEWLSAQDAQSNSEAPSVMNPFDFPSLKVGKKSKVKAARKVSEEGYESDRRDYANGVNGSSTHGSGDADEINGNSNYRADQNGETNVNYFDPVELADFVAVLCDPLFLKVFPAVVTDPTFTIPNPKIVSLNERISTAVRITNVYSPSQFWFQYGQDTLQPLLKQLEDFYSSVSEHELMISNENLQPGLVVAAMCFGVWQRARIVGKEVNDDLVEVFLIDVGCKVFCNRYYVRYLLEQFTSSPKRALRGSLVDAYPQNVIDWNFKIRQQFFNLVNDKALYATIRFHREVDDVFRMELSYEVDSINLGQMLTVGAKEISKSSSYAALMPFA